MRQVEVKDLNVKNKEELEDQLNTLIKDGYSIKEVTFINEVYTGMGENNYYFMVIVQKE